MDSVPDLSVTSDSLSDSWLEDCFKTSCTSEYQLPDVAPAGIDESGSVRITGAVGERTNQRRTPSKPHSTPLTLKWLDDNYEIVEGVCIPRSTLYVHYLDFCEKNDCQPVNAASFGKIIRQQFPQITTRRLGTRGQSKYHYYGVGVKESSPYYDVIYSSKGVQNSADGKKDTTKQVIAYSPRSKLGTLLPEFPNVSDLKLPPDIPQEKVVTFLMMYRTHCQRILDTVIRANFDEVQSFLLHFWQGMPQHMVPILGSACITNLVGVCDSILYKAISGVLMPTVLQALPESLTQVIKKFAKQLRDWINAALEGLPQTLNNMKSTLATTFAQSLRRQTSLNHLCQASRTVVHSGDITAQMLEDWYSVDINSVCKQTLYTMQDYNSKDYGLITSLCKEFENLMEDQEPIELYTEWLDRMIDTCVIQMASEKQPGSVKQKARQFLLTWSFFGTRIIRELTLHSAPSFGSFHLLHLMFDDYVMYRVESLCSQETANQLLMAAKGEKTNVITEEVILPNPSITLSSPSAFDASLSTPALPTSSLDDHCRTSCSIGYESSNNILTSPLASVQQHFDGSLQMVNNISLEMHDSPCTPSSYGVDSFCRSNNSLSIQEPVFNSYGFNGSQFSAIPPYNNCLRRTDSNHWAMTSQPAFQTAIQNTTPDIGSYEYSAFTNFTRPHNPETYQAFTESSPFYDVSSGKRPIESVNESDGTRVQSTDSTYTPLPHSYQLS